MLALEEEAKKREQEMNNVQTQALGTNNDLLNALFMTPDPTAVPRQTGFMMSDPPIS